MRNKKTLELIEVLEKRAIDTGYEIIDVEIVGPSHGQILRVYIDSKLKDNGIDLDDIVEAQKWIEETIDSSDPISGEFTLEVSSPGIDRPLRKLEHFEKAAGETVVIKTTPIEGRKNWKGTLIEVDNQDIVIDLDGKLQKVPFTAIEKANVKGELNFNSRED